MTERAVPFYCPYCGEEDLEPKLPTKRASQRAVASEERNGGGGWDLEPREHDGNWHCRSCARAFRLTFAGVGAAL